MAIVVTVSNNPRTSSCEIDSDSGLQHCTLEAAAVNMFRKTGHDWHAKLQTVNDPPVRLCIGRILGIEVD